VIYFVLAQAINIGMRQIERRLARGRMRGGLS
jgi:polar amino acid transport system permease protein